MALPKISAEFEQQIVERYQSGESIYRIAADLPWAPQTVHKVLVRRGVELRTKGGRPRRQLSVIDRQWILQQYHDLARAQDIARELRTSLTTVYDVLREAGISLRGQGQQPHRPKRDELERIVSLWNQGKRVSGIAAATGHGSETIERILREIGIFPVKGPLRGPESPGWKGGRVRLGRYVGVWVSHESAFRVMANRDGYVLEHRLMMAMNLGRLLNRWETVHHINGIRDDNRLENLQLRSGKHGSGAAFRCLNCGSVNIEAVHLA